MLFFSKLLRCILLRFKLSLVFSKYPICIYIDDCASVSSTSLFHDGMSSQAWGEAALPIWVQEPRLRISELDERAAVEILRVPDRVSHSLPHVVKHLPPDRGQFSGYSKCEGDKRWDSPKATGVSRGSSNSGQDSFLFLQTHLWFLSWSLNYRLLVSHTCLGSLQKALIVLQHITVLQSFKEK